METFGKLFEDMGVKAGAMGDAMDQATGGSVNLKEVMHSIFNNRNRLTT